MKNNSLLIFNSICHFLVDALCVSLVVRGFRLADAGLAASLYNLIAFAGQAPAGLLIDRIGRPHLWQALGMGLCFGALLLPLGIPACLLSGLGNCLFHVGAGCGVIQNEKNDIRHLGIFVAPGALGVFWGTAHWKGAAFYGAGCLIGALLSPFAARPSDSPQGSSFEREDAKKEPSNQAAVVLLLMASVAVRAIGGSAAAFPWKSNVIGAFLFASVVFFGKLAGGYLAKLFGIIPCSAVSIAAAAVLTAFYADSMLPALWGQFLLNLSMPVTLHLMVKALPGRPAAAFGLAAAALLPGTLIGSSIQGLENYGPALIFGSFLFGLSAIIYADKNLRKEF